MSIRESLVLTLLCEDRPGMVELVSKVVADHDGNWLRSHLSSVAGHFGGIIHVTAPAESLEKLLIALRELEMQGLDILVRSSPKSARIRAKDHAILDLVGQDRPGIVAQISKVIAEHDASIDEFFSELSSAPMSGSEIFKARAHIAIPKGCSVEDLRGQLELIASDLMVDITVEPLDL